MKWFFILYLVLGSAHAAECTKFKIYTEKTMEARQEGRKINQDPTNNIELDMSLNAWQWPQYRSKHNKQQAVNDFVYDWLRACTQGWYGE